MPNLSYMLVNFVYLTGMAVWVGAVVAGLVVFRGRMREAPGAGRSLARLIHLQVLALLAAAAATVVKAVLWESTHWPFLVRYFFLAAMGLTALLAVWRLGPLLSEAPEGTAVRRATPFLVIGLLLGLAALLFS